MTHSLIHLTPPATRHERIDPPAAEQAAAGLLRALRVDVTGEGVSDTPRRIARMYGELLTPRPFTPTTFPNDGGYDELVVATDRG